MKKRLFIAIIPPAEVQGELFRTIKPLADNNRQIRQIPAANIHLTLKFLGDTEAEKIEKIKAVLSVAVSGLKSFHYTLSERIDAFPGLSSARIIFVPVAEGSKQIYDVFMSIEKGLKGIGISQDPRRFTAHITLARLKEAMNLKVESEKFKLKADKNILCPGIVLFESILKTSGAEYIILEEFKIK